MTQSLHSVRFPGESPEYRRARDELLTAEIALRRQIEQVAQLRRALPLGGAVPQDYAFEECGHLVNGARAGRQVALSGLFESGKNTLILYSFMFGPAMDNACPSCTSILDALDGSAQHVLQRVNFAVVAKSPAARICAFAQARGWRRLRLLSSEGNSYNRDYQGENAEGSQRPALNVFVKRDGRIYHQYCTELMFAPMDPGQEPRHVDFIWPIWSLFDVTPEGRGDFHAKLDYSAS